MNIAAKHEKVLVVDDDPNVRRTLSLCLRDIYDITEVSSGEKAIEACQAGDFSVVVLDLRMGGISGIDALKVIKSKEDSPSVIILTAYESKESAISAVNYGAFNYLTKPFDRNHLKHVVAEGCAAYNRQHARDQEMRSKLEEIHNSFFSILCHEFNTPLNGILGFSELLTDSLEDPEHRSWARAVGVSGDRLHDLLMEMIDYVGASHMAAEKIDITFVPGELFRPLRKVFEKKQISLEVVEREAIAVRGPSKAVLVLARQLIKIISRDREHVRIETIVETGDYGRTELKFEVCARKGVFPMVDPDEKSWAALPLWYTFASGGKSPQLEVEIAALKKVAEHAGGTLEASRLAGELRFVVRVPVKLVQEVVSEQ